MGKKQAGLMHAQRGSVKYEYGGVEWPGSSSRLRELIMLFAYEAYLRYNAQSGRFKHYWKI